MVTRDRNRVLDMDLWIIFAISAAVLVIYSILGSGIGQFVNDSSVNIVLRVLFGGGIFQFGLAGLGITVVALLRKENFLSYGLHMKNILPTLLLSAGCCIPDFIYNACTGNVHRWLPFSGVHLTSEVLVSGFPWNVMGMLIIVVCWGFFEGFNYVVICDKLSERYPSGKWFWDVGACFCAIMCIVIHGVIGITPDAVIEMLCTMFLIYGMLLVRKKTGNAWGCILIFILYWNAI